MHGFQRLPIRQSSGRVTDENGNPLAGATVNLTGVPTATTTTRRKWRLHIWVADGRQQLHSFCRSHWLYFQFRSGEQSPKECET